MGDTSRFVVNITTSQSYETQRESRHCSRDSRMNRTQACYFLPARV
jgi:hypothetical protein